MTVPSYTEEPLVNFVVEISSLTEETLAGRLNKDRAADLDQRLRELEAARRRAWKELRCSR